MTLSVLPLMNRAGTLHMLEDDARWWVTRLTRARQQGRLVRHYLEVRYEDLVREPEPTLRQKFAFLDLPWDPAVVQYHELSPGSSAGERNPHPLVSDSPALQTTAVLPDPAQIGRWATQSSRGVFGFHLDKAAPDLT